MGLSWPLLCAVSRNFKTSHDVGPGEELASGCLCKAATEEATAAGATLIMRLISLDSDFRVCMCKMVVTEARAAMA